MVLMRSAVFLMALVAISATRLSALTAADYDTTKIEGWTVRIEKSLATHERRAAAVKLLRSKLVAIKEVVPAEAVKKLKTVPIWLSRNSARGAAYHPSAGWLTANGRVPEMERSIEIQNIDDFIDWSTGQPWMMLHELAHAWHHQFADQSYANPVILKAYGEAVESGDYEEVKYYDGRRMRHYALTNQMEYFAECTEAYFGRNDFQPFARKALRNFDPAGHRMVRKVWGVVEP